DLGQAGKGRSLEAETGASKGAEANRLVRIRCVVAFAIEGRIRWQWQSFGTIAHHFVPRNGARRHVEEIGIIAPRQRGGERDRARTVNGRIVTATANDG